MVSVNAIALSGLRASEERIAVAADNIANANTPGFKSVSVRQISQAGGGVDTVVTNPNTTSITEAANQNTQPSDVSIEQQLVDAQTASYDFKANLKVLQVEKKLQESLLDIQA